MGFPHNAAESPAKASPWPKHCLQPAIAVKSPIVLHQSVQTSNEWITGRRGDPAVVLPVLGHVDVAFVAPAFTPAVKQHQQQTVRCVKFASVQQL